MAGPACSDLSRLVERSAAKRFVRAGKSAGLAWPRGHAAGDDSGGAGHGGVGGIQWRGMFRLGDKVLEQHSSVERVRDGTQDHGARHIALVLCVKHGEVGTGRLVW